MKGLKLVAILLCLCFVAGSCGNMGRGGADFVKVEEGKFVKDGKPYYFIGANMWYAALLASEGEGGDRERLAVELDSLQAMGVDNIRVIVGSDGPHGVRTKFEPVMQTSPGVYNDTLLQGLDYLMADLGRRGMKAVLYLTNSWEWSGGFGQYLEWAGFGTAPLSSELPWKDYCDFLTQFYESEEAVGMYYDHLRKIVSRVNTVTGKPYSEDEAIFSWQICNEPRPFSSANKDAFARWVEESASLIKSLDTNHMVSTGSEGLYGCEVDMDLFAKIHSIPEIDYFNIHIWPYNWNWVTKENLDSVEIAISESEKYIEAHLPVVRSVGKPLVIEEFGYPRDGFSFERGTLVAARDRYYEYICGLVIESASSGGCIAGCNFWAWGGMAPRTHGQWLPGDAFSGDPAHEPQGFYSVYDDDATTISVIRRANREL